MISGGKRAGHRPHNSHLDSVTTIRLRKLSDVALIIQQACTRC